MGSDLLKQIVQLTHITFEFGRQKTGDHAILEALKVCLNEGHNVDKLNEHLRAGWQLSRSATQAISIDNVIDALEDPKIELIGKLGIVRAILKAEASSSAFRRINDAPDTLDLSSFENTWYCNLTKLLTEEVRKSDIEKIFNNLEIINFNYDRCLENYLPHSLANYYGVKPDAIRDLMRSLVIHRPYGVAGRLPWQQGDAPGVGFGECSPHQLAAVAQQVRTFTERVEEGTHLNAIRKAISSADRIVFLGFAFHRQNIELIAHPVQDHAEIVATAYQISESDKAVIDQELTTAFEFRGVFNDDRVDLADMTCQQFFREYWRTLTAEKSDREPVDMPGSFPRMHDFRSFGG